MSYSIDANILIFASNNSSDFYDQSKAFLNDRLETNDIFYLTWGTVMAYLRISTHRRIFAKPLSPETATQNIDRLMARRQVHLITENERFWQAYLDLCNKTVIRANLVPDAHLAATLLAQGVSTLYTHDRDFRKFDGITVIDPLC